MLPHLADAAPCCSILPPEMQIVHFQLGKKNPRDTNGGFSFANVTSVCRMHSLRILDPENLARHLGVPKNAGRNPVPPGMYPSR